MEYIAELNITDCGWSVILSDQNKSDRTFMRFHQSIIRGVARPGVMVRPLYDYFAASWFKAIFHVIRQYSQNKIIHIILFKLKCISNQVNAN